MKKIKLLLPSLVLILFLSFSFLMKPSVKASETLTDQQLVERSIANINIRTEAIASFPVTYKSAFGATITWTSSDNSVIDATKVAETNGWVIVYRDADVEKSATLTVTVTLNDASEQKSQEVTVPAGTTITNTYNVTYDFGTLTDVTNSNPATHKASTYHTLENASKDGYTFIGWYSDKACTQEMKCLPVGMYEDITVYGKLEKNKTQLTVPTVPAMYEYAYDGKEHKVNVTADDKIRVTYSENNKLTNVGDETVTVNFEILAQYKDDYELVGETTQTTTLKVNKKAITVKADDITATYGEAEKTLTYQVTEGSIVTTDSLEFTATKAPGVNVGNYDITLTANDTYKNYDITFEKGTYSITKATLAVKPTALSINKGATLPTNVQKTIEGFKLTDDETILTGTLAYDFTGVDVSISATYEFTISGYDDLTNYNIVYEKGSIIVNDSAVTIEIAEEDLTTSYNGTVQKLDESKVSFKNNGTIVTLENSTMKYTLNGEETDPKNAGTYVLTVSFTDSVYGTGSHTFNYVISKKDATITLNEQTHTYDGNVFTLAQDAYTTSGLVDGDTIDGIIIKFVDSSKEAKNAGNYDITAEFTANSNYNVTVNDNKLVIAKAAAEITAEDITATYDGTTHSVNATLNHNETELNYSENSFKDVKYDAENNVTFYEVTVTAAETANYIAAEKTVKVTINPIALTVTIDNQTEVYSGAEPVVDQTKYTVTEGTKIGEDDLGITLTKAAGVDVTVDGYAITGISSNGNYKVEFVNGTYSITKAPLTLVIDNKTVEKNAAFPEYTYSFDGFVNGETVDTISELFIVEFKVLNEKDNVVIDNTETEGTYTITATEDDYILDDCNYEIINVTNGILTIEKSTSEKVTADAKAINEKYADVITVNKMFLPTLDVSEENGSNIVWTTDTDGVTINTNGNFVIDEELVTGDSVTVVLMAECTISDAVAYSKGIKFIIRLTKGLTAENPYSASEAIEDASKLSKNEYSSERVYVIGSVQSIVYNENHSNYTLEIVDIDGDSSKFKIYGAVFDADIEVAIVGSEILAYGYLQNYNGDTPELSYKGDENPLIISVTTSNEAKLAAAKTQVETELNKYSSLTTAPTDKLIVNAKFNSTVTYSSSNPTVLDISEDGTITMNPSEESDTDVTVTYTISLDGSSINGTKTITVKKTGTSPVVEVEAKYSGSTTNMTYGSNNADKIGLDSTIFTVETGKKNNLTVGLNKDGEIRTYNGAALTISIDSTYTISYIIINTSSTITVSVDGSAVTLTNGKYEINADSFIISSSTTAKIKSIKIGYSTK